MKESFHDFYDDKGSKNQFHHVIALNQEEMAWESLLEKSPGMPRGWYELSRLSKEDRIEFTREYWLGKIPLISIHADYLEGRLYNFFDKMDDIAIFVTQATVKEPFEPHMIYSLTEDRGFFHGSPPISTQGLENLVKQFANISFPPDYLAFLQIHDGFSKYTDTGLIKSFDLSKTFQSLKQSLSETVLIRPDGQILDPNHLIPFYESFGLHCYQCFYSDWYPESEMGNLYFSESNCTVSNFFDRENLEENLAFPTFLEWLLFYLEDIEDV